MMKIESDRKEHEEREQERERNLRREMELKRERLGEEERDHDEGVSPPPCKRPNSGDDDDITALPERREQIIHNTIPGTNIKITSRGITY